MVPEVQGRSHPLHPWEAYGSGPSFSLEPELKTSCYFQRLVLNGDLRLLCKCNTSDSQLAHTPFTFTVYCQ